MKTVCSRRKKGCVTAAGRSSSLSEEQDVQTVWFGPGVFVWRCRDARVLISYALLPPSVDTNPIQAQPGGKPLL